MQKDPEAPAAAEEFVFSSTVEHTLGAIFPSDDPLDAASFDPIAFVNANFPNERSLSRMDTFLAQTERKIAQLDDEIFGAVVAQAAAGKQADDEVAEVKVAIRDLFQKIKDIKEKAEESEVMVKEISRDIKKLDYAKRHLTTTITGLKRLHMLVTAVDQLEFMAQRREYGDAANLLNAVNELSQHFEQYTGVPKVDEMRKAVLDTRRALKGQVLQDFRDIQPASSGAGEYGEYGGGGDLGGEADDFGGGVQDHAQLHDACLVVDALGGDVRERIMERFCSDQLGVYDGIFRQGGGEDTLAAVERRYSWWRRTLRKYEKSFGDVFPGRWEMDRELCMDFARRTRRHIEIILRAIDPPESADVEALLNALRKTLQFEREAAQMFDTNRGHDDGRGGGGGQSKRRSSSGNNFEYTGGIGGASVSMNDDGETLYDDEGNVVDPDSATGIRLRYRRKQAEEKRKQEMKRNKKKKKEKENKGSGGGSDGNDDDGSDNVDTESVDGDDEDSYPRVSFFGSISTCFGNYMSAYVKLERRNMDDKLEEMVAQEDVDEDIKALGSSYHLFGYMHNSIKRCCNYTTGQAFFDLQVEYKHVLSAYANILTSKLPKPTGTTASGEATYSLGVIGSSSSDAAVRLACYIVNTADYCAENIPKLEENIKSRIDENFVDRVDMENLQDDMYDAINVAIRVLASGLCTRAESKLESGMLRTNWQTHSDVGDASLFVQEICSLVEDVTLVCKDILSDEYFQSFCASFATAFLPQFVLALHRCKRIGDVGAQQLLLDTYGIKTLFLGLRSLGEEEEDAGTRRMDPYTKRVLREVSKAESLLKLVGYPSDALAQGFPVLWPTGNLSDLRVLMQLKGMKAQEQTAVLAQVESSGAVSGTLAEAGGAGATPPGSGSIGVKNARNVADQLKKKSAFFTKSFSKALDNAGLRGKR